MKPVFHLMFYLSLLLTANLTCGQAEEAGPQLFTRSLLYPYGDYALLAGGALLTILIAEIPNGIGETGAKGIRPSSLCRQQR